MGRAILTPDFSGLLSPTIKCRNSTSNTPRPFIFIYFLPNHQSFHYSTICRLRALRALWGVLSERGGSALKCVLILSVGARCLVWTRSRTVSRKNLYLHQMFHVISLWNEARRRNINSALLNSSSFIYYFQKISPAGVSAPDTRKLHYIIGYCKTSYRYIFESETFVTNRYSHLYIL